VRSFEAEIWLMPGESGWHFATLPHDVADEVRARTAGTAPFNTAPVTVTIGGTTWETSIFADRKSASYLLPVKADVRRRENLGAGDRVTIAVELRE
jgi:Domain of unknown function (DUF1905)